MRPPRHSPKESEGNTRIAKSKSPNLTDEFIRAAISPYGVELNGEQVTAIRQYLELLLHWNQKINLTSIVNPAEILGRHFGESMFAAAVVPRMRGRLADVGSGAGFPGLAIKLVCNQLDITLIEPIQKKAVFLAEVARALELAGVEILRIRIADLYLTDSFDLVTARAVGAIDSLLKWAGRSLRRDGQVVLWLGGKDAEKISSASSWVWGEPIRIPQSRSRFLIVGQLEH